MKNLILSILFVLLWVTNMAKSSKTEEPKLSDFIGTYKMETFFELATITEKDGFLYAELDGYGVNKLIKQPETDTFKSTSSYGTIFIFQRDASNKVVGVKLKIMDNEVNGIKTK
jgi:Domain of unknown function (DUF3471)